MFFNNINDNAYFFERENELKFCINNRLEGDYKLKA